MYKIEIFFYISKILFRKLFNHFFFDQNIIFMILGNVESSQSGEQNEQIDSGESKWRREATDEQRDPGESEQAEGAAR